MKAVGTNQKGFTIVELLIVIVVIAILAAIAIVAYSGMQQRSRDARRSSDLTSLQKVLEVYKGDKGGYPTCAASPGTYVVGAAAGYNTAAYCLADDLVPDYTSQIPTDPRNTGSYQYFYAVGHRKTGATSWQVDTTQQTYTLGVKQETVTSPLYTGWSYNDLTLLLGSHN